LNLFERLDIAVQTARGISWLHNAQPSIIHRDLKTANLLYDAEGRIKVCDFGLSQSLITQYLQDNNFARGSPLYMAPEVMRGEPFTEKIDIYSFGLIIWELITCQSVFSNYRTLLELKAGVTSGVRPLIYSDSLDEGRKAEFFALFNDKLLTFDAKKQISYLLNSMWNNYPQSRPPINIVHEKLKEIMISLIEDTASQKVWASLTTDSNFSLIDYDYFESFVLERCPSDDLKRDVKAFLPIALNIGSTINKKVSIDLYAQFIRYFGPFDNNLPNRFHQLCLMPWFHGPLKNEDEVSLLKKMNNQTNEFFVRYCSAKDGSYTVHINQRKYLIKRVILNEDPNNHLVCFEFNQKRYNSLIDVIESNRTLLGTPVEGSRFEICLKERKPEYDTFPDKK